MRTKTATLRAAPLEAPADGTEVDLSMLEQMVGFHVHMFDLAMYQSFYERFAERAFTPAIFSTLAVIRQNPGIRHGALADALRIQRPNLTSLLNKLERVGYVSRRPAAGDKRSVALCLTDRGERAVTKMSVTMLAFDRDATASLSAHERKNLLGLLRKALNAAA
jgi:DNA-binding MarR family transcriptional regulator